VKIAILPQFLAIEPHFVRKGCRGHNFIAVFGNRTLFRAKGLSRHTQNRNFTAVFGDRTKGCRGTLKIAILPQFLAIELHFVRKGCRGTLKIAILAQFWRSNLISCERVAFCAVSLALPRALREK